MSRRNKVAIILVTCLLTIILFPPVKKIDRSPYQESPSYRQMQDNIGQVNIGALKVGQGFKAGYSKQNITPKQPIATAGYGNRKGADYTSVRDSIYVRTIVLDNGVQKIALVSVDLLIFPPTVTAILSTELSKIGFSLDDTYLSATHSHNSIGGWGEHLAGRIVSGPPNDSIVSSIARAVVKSILIASRNVLPATLKSGHLPVAGAVRNRLIEKGKADSLLRVIEVLRVDGKKLIVTSFTAHPTCLAQEDLELSRDYPGELVDNLEHRGYEFAMFMGGAMGSMTGRSHRGGESCINWMAEDLTYAVLHQQNLLTSVNGSTLMMRRIPLELREPQLKISKDWSLSPWWFRNLFGEYPAHLTVLRIGDLVMLGTPCDFSGELTEPVDKVASNLGLNAMITSFNGGYIGYITNDKHYDLDNSETRLMNWYGPGNGNYLSECMIQLMEKTVQ